MITDFGIFSPCRKGRNMDVCWHKLGFGPLEHATKVTHLGFPKEETTCQRTTRSHHGPHDETGLTHPHQIPVVLNVSTLASWPFLVL